ncbi:MATE family efflux transporter [Kinneretia asaccharophila]|uniref:Putative MATE family efflux protein n=1 Tax=Roseateles asaccharophilus TaxID=582607 RepID=A0A4R6NAK4_9BURK|nr:MATE family efflux transporter [Roseateles asaccharophilus]MDN3544857.1 MATE family efflux transporter [Roseateles asaccharophilus]TDP12756.1 putative MATE family efflux protein [Roseateles asaccharophilus]
MPPHTAPSPRLFALAWPLFIELLLGLAVGMIGTLLAARVSDAAGAAFALANHVLATLFILFRIIGAGVSVVVTQSLGGGRRDQADALARAALGASSWIGLLGGAAALLGAGPLLRLLNAPAEVLPLAQPFLMALAPALLLDAWNACMASVMRAHLRSRDTLAVLVAMQLCQLALAIPLMQWLGLPGFALALVLSRGLGLGLHLGLWRLRLGLRPQWGDWWRLPRRELATVLHIGLPGAAENIAYRLAYMVSIAVAGTLGASALAAHSYASQLMYFVLLPGLATGFAAEIVVGHLIGAGRLHEAHRLVRRALARGLLISVVVATLAALASPWLLRQFSTDAGIVSAGVTLMWLTVLLEPGRTFNLVVINALRAAGDARYPVMVGAGSMLLVLAGGSWLLGHVLGWGLVGLWIAYAADEWLRGLLMWRRWATQGWVPHARGVHRRLHRRHPL